MNTWRKPIMQTTAKNCSKGEAMSESQAYKVGYLESVIDGSIRELKQAITYIADSPQTAKNRVNMVIDRMTDALQTIGEGTI